MLTGVYVPTEGTVILNGVPLNGRKTHQFVEAGVARTFQNIRLFKEMSVIDNVKAAFTKDVKYNMQNPQNVFMSNLINLVLGETTLGKFSDQQIHLVGAGDFKFSFDSVKIGADSNHINSTDFLFMETAYSSTSPRPLNTPIVETMPSLATKPEREEATACQVPKPRGAKIQAMAPPMTARKLDSVSTSPNTPS